MCVQQVQQLATAGIGKGFEQQVGVIVTLGHGRLHASNLLHEL
jgi:hypothetical protein